MSPALAQAVLALHLVVIGFNVAGLVVIPLGAKLDWRFVRVRWLRLLHLAAWVAVAAQAATGRACVLTDWQGALSGGGAEEPMIVRWVNGLIYWPLPIWAFTTLYLALFAYVVALWWIAPPSPRPSSGRR